MAEQEYDAEKFAYFTSDEILRELYKEAHEQELTAGTVKGIDEYLKLDLPDKYKERIARELEQKKIDAECKGEEPDHESIPTEEKQQE